MFWRYRAHLEAELIKQELLLKFIIADKEKLMLRQDEELKLLRAECERYKLLLLPRLVPQQPGSKPKAPTFVPTETSWQAYVAQHMREQEELIKKEKADGVHRQSGEGFHESASSDAVRPDDGHKQVATAEVRAANGQK